MAMTTGTPIAIHLETHVTQNGETEKHVFDEKGQLVQIGQSLYIRYKETSEDDGSLIPVTLKIEQNGDIQLSRGDTNGSTHMKLFFAQGKKVLTRYRTPYGIIPVETVTPNMRIRIKNQPVSGEIYVEYQLFAEGQHLGDYQLSLIFTA
ncbi:hypothetical protein IV38_GL001732 [Lactobacillus selangorensis]|uniref:YwiB n=1 Tax=Lactobacillus selangorensis TaxID=81857 RepID=A0A0R2FNG0_9LACO|nr:DUF1934 domain-containing protein [Lactobacillus selangorensis]KRN27893.1 hypothetical protein IV38_GL001732 [Lactobacillus selangorensis]KRN30636.1 hypothetical protein IV40_GL001823 [Lactobacillus selangorensis]